MSADFRCPSCGKKLFSYEPRFRKYGKITANCKSCGALYADPRCYELALGGIPGDEYLLGPYISVIAIGALIVWRGVYIMGQKQLGVMEEMQWFLPSAFLVIGGLMVIGGIIGAILLKAGIKAKRLEKKLEESKLRLRDPVYVNELRSLGFPVDERM